MAVTARRVHLPLGAVVYESGKMMTITPSTVVPAWWMERFTTASPLGHRSIVNKGLQRLVAPLWASKPRVVINIVEKCHLPICSRRRELSHAMQRCRRVPCAVNTAHWHARRQLVRVR